MPNALLNNELRAFPALVPHGTKPAARDQPIPESHLVGNIVGGVISPLLANLYLHWFEKAFHKQDGPATWAKAKLVRYADDFVILARYQSPRLIQWVDSLLEGRFQLTLNREKTKPTRA